MTFADELRSSKGPQLTKEEIAGRQYWLNFHVKAVLEELKRLARRQNNAGKHSVSGWLANDYFLCLVEIQKKFVYNKVFLEKNNFCLESLCGNYPGCIDDLRREIEKRLKQLGFRASVKKVEVPLYYSLKSDFWGRPKKVGIGTTLEIEFSW